MNVPQCEQAVQRALEDPKIKTLVQHLGSSMHVGTPPLDASPTEIEKLLMIECRECSASGAEALARAVLEYPPKTVTLCINRLRDGAEVREALTHELVHAYDFFVKRRDHTDSHQLAYSEIRAAREAECASKLYILEWMRRACIRQKAINSTASMFPSQAQEAVDAVLSSAMVDNEPFEGSTNTKKN